MTNEDQNLEVDSWPYDHTEDDDDSRGLPASFQISYFPADFTLGGYLEKNKQKQLVIPPFQRNYVWDVKKASRLIESFLLGLPVPGVFLYKERKTNKLQVIDGQQRITSAIRFFESRFDETVFRLQGVQPRWEGKTFDELDEGEQFHLKDSVLRATVVQQLDPEDDSSIYHVFERLNTGGVNLNPMEVRKCVYFGAYFSMIEELNEHSSWRELIGKDLPDKRLRDAELLLRVLALGHHDAHYSKPMKAFLNGHLVSAKRLPTGELEKRIAETVSRFKSVSDYVLSELGRTPFHLRSRLNFALTDVVMAAIFDGGIPDARVLAEAFPLMLKDESFIDAVSISTSDERQVKRRFEVARAALYG